MKYFARHKKKCLVIFCNLTMAFSLTFFSGCIAGADYENKMICVYRTTGPKVLEQFKVTRSKKEISPPQATETPDEILFRIIDTEIKRSGQLVYASVSYTIIHAEADKLKKLFPELRIAVVHPPFSEWTRCSETTGGFISVFLEYRRGENRIRTSTWRATTDPPRLRMIQRKHSPSPASSALSRSVVPHA